MRHASTSVLLSVVLITAACTEDPVAVPSASRAAAANASAADDHGHTTYAVIGDFPYGPQKRAELPALVDLINADPLVERVLHVGDIKAGSNSDCSDAYFADIRQQFDRFDDPFVYTPGDNEWTDWHVQFKNNGLYTPTERLIAARNVFFPEVGRTLGVRSARVVSQAEVDPANAQYVENVMWRHADVVFASVNITGSDNDTAPWASPLPPNAASFPSQAEEQATRAQATRAWIARAFETAKEANAPFTAASPLFVLHPNTPVAPNVIRLVVNGSASRTEYVRLTINPEARSGDVFTFEEVPLF
jgi:hypothetical protein